MEERDADRPAETYTEDELDALIGADQPAETYTEDELDALIGAAAPARGKEGAGDGDRPAETYTNDELDAGPVVFLRKQERRFVEEASLRPFHGCLLTEAEIRGATQYGSTILPMELLPRFYPRDAPPPPVTYRRRAYGPYDHLSPEALRLAPALHNFRTAAHRGQTKLCGVELEALVRALRRIPDLKYVLYAGAAPGEHIAFLAEAFPALEFHLVDPAPFRVHRRYKAFPGIEGRIHITPGLFTDELALAWKGRAPKTIFFSDIRSGDHNQEEFELEVQKNMEMQRTWWKLAGFGAALFKLRFPYTDGKTSSKCVYLDGDVLLQPFGPNTSTEGRLLVWAGAGERVYDSVDYENFYYWLNTVVREWGSFDHGFDLGMVPGLCRCFDCSRTVQIFREYAGEYPDRECFSSTDAQVAYMLGRMVAATEQRFFSPPHGDLVDLLPVAKRETLARRHGSEYVAKRNKKVAERNRSEQHAPPVVQPHLRPPRRGAAPAAPAKPAAPAAPAKPAVPAKPAAPKATTAPAAPAASRPLSLLGAIKLAPVSALKDKK